MYGPPDPAVEQRMARIGTSLFAILCALLATAAPVQAASCNGASHQPMLSNGSASPASGTSATVITFSVTFADTGDCAPSAVTVTIDGVGTYAMGGSGVSYASGVAYSVALTFGPGTYAYSFAATSGEGGGVMTTTLTAVSPGSVSIAAPPPPPPPAVTPPPKPRPATPKPVPPPPPTATPTVSTSPSPTPGETPTPELTPSAPNSASPIATALIVHDSWSPAPAAVVASASPLTTGGVGPLAVAGVLATYLTATAAGLAFFALLMRSPRWPSGATASGARVPAMAFAAPAVPARAATTASTPGTVTPLPPMRELVPPVDPDLLRDSDETRLSPEEARVPRWLRPSVRDARGGATELRHRNWRA